MGFVAAWRQYMHTAVDYDIKAYGYIFTQPQLFTHPPEDGGKFIFILDFSLFSSMC